MIMHLTRRMISKFVSHTIVLAAGVFVGSMTVLMPRSQRIPTLWTTTALSKDESPQVYNKSSESKRVGDGGEHCNIFSQNVAKMVSRSHLLQNFCPCCGFHGNFTVFNGRPHAMCPSRLALERHRTACFNLAKHDLLVNPPTSWVSSPKLCPSPCGINTNGIPAAMTAA